MRAHEPPDKQNSQPLAGRKAGRQVDRQAGRQVGRKAGRQVGRMVGRKSQYKENTIQMSASQDSSS